MFYRFCNLSVTPFRLKIISKLFLGHFFYFLTRLVPHQNQFLSLFFTRPVLHYQRERPRARISDRATKNRTGTTPSEDGIFIYFQDVGVPGKVRGRPRTARF